jgi:hypothetical protein
MGAAIRRILSGATDAAQRSTCAPMEPTVKAASFSSWPLRSLRTRRETAAMVGVMARLSVFAIVCSACTVKNPHYCNEDADCKDRPLTFCDLAGEFPESDHTVHTCTIPPASCPIERCGCEPGAGLKCDVDQLTSCNADGHTSSTKTCALGCSTAEPRCLTFEPSNGLGAALEMAESEPEMTIPSGSRIDTDLGLLQDPRGQTISVKTVVVDQDGGTSVLALVARSFVIDDLAAGGSRALALVAADTVTLRGRMDASAAGIVRGPGALESPAACAGGSAQIANFGGSSTYGGGGGGNATPGAPGGGFDGSPTPGGGPTPGFTPLVGGCAGGRITNPNGSTYSLPGAGGGAVQFVAGERIVFRGSGFLDIGGGGGQSSAGGGSGGTAVLEAPVVLLDGATTGIAANGGGGGGCNLPGADATPNASPAVAPKCAAYAAGNGGTTMTLPQPGELTCGNPCQHIGFKGGGGGAVGRLRVATKSGHIEKNGVPLVEAVISTAELVLR